eukprot:scaffold113329_cov14-Prasinocladus_malaysianus.AAC.1
MTALGPWPGLVRVACHLANFRAEPWDDSAIAKNENTDGFGHNLVDSQVSDPCPPTDKHSLQIWRTPIAAKAKGNSPLLKQATLLRIHWGFLQVLEIMHHVRASPALVCLFNNGGQFRHAT